MSKKNKRVNPGYRQKILQDWKNLRRLIELRLRKRGAK